MSNKNNSQLSENDKMQEQVFKYEYVLEALSDIGDELCRVTSFDAQLKSLLHLLLGTLGIRKGGIFLYDKASQTLSLECAWKLAHKSHSIEIEEQQLKELTENSEEITYRAKEYKPLEDLVKHFEADKLDCVSVLKVRERFIGLLIVGHKLKEVALDEKEMSFLKTLSRNISVAINNYIMLSDLRNANTQLDEKMQEVSILYQASQMISSELQLHALMSMGMNAITGITTIECGTAWLYDEEHQTINLATQVGDSHLTVKHIDLAESKLFQFARDTKEAFEIKDLKFDVGETEAYYNVQISPIEEEFFGESFLIIPILNQGDTLGLVHLRKEANAKGFTARDIRLIKVFAIQLGAAVKNAQLYEQAITDGMTKLYLHRYFKQRLLDEIKRASRFKRHLALIMVDIDHFKSLNDNYGHQTGDEVLKRVANILKKAIRIHDLPVRYGGEEFALVLPETDMLGAVAVAERIRKTIEKEVFRYCGANIQKTASFGVSVYPDCALNMEALIKAADVALYWSKEHGRNQVTAAPSMQSRGTHPSFELDEEAED